MRRIVRLQLIDLGYPVIEAEDMPDIAADSRALRVPWAILRISSRSCAAMFSATPQWDPH